MTATTPSPTRNLVGVNDSAKGVRWAVLALSVLTLAAFIPVLENDFVGWDDDQNIVRNSSFRGLSFKHLSWMCTTSAAGHYQPLTWLSYALETQLLWGVSAAGFHFTNLLLHLATAIGFFFVAKRLLYVASPSLPCSSVVAGALLASFMFAVHPLRVESVAWATERRDVLSGAWWIVAVGFYLRHATRTGRPRKWLIVSLACYVLSLLSKATGMTLPIVLILLDVYPLRRLGAPRGSDVAPPCAGLSDVAPPLVGGAREILWEKVVYLIPALACAVAALWAQADVGALRTLEQHSLSLRVSQAFHGILFYLGKSLWPVNLVPLYEQRPDASPVDTVNLLACAGVVVLTAILWKLRRRQPGLIVAWAVYIVLLSPMLGLAQSGPQVVADRYTYLPSMSLALLAGAGLACWWAHKEDAGALVRHAPVVALVLIVGCWVALTRDQTRVWRDTYTLWTTVVARRPETSIAHANLAAELNERGEFERGRDHALEALRQLPGNRTAHAALAHSMLELGDLDAAERHSRIALEIADRVGRIDTQTMIGLAIVQTRLGRLGEAERLYREAVRLEPQVADWPFNLGGFLASRGRFDEARAAFEETLRLQPDFASARFRLGIVWLNLGDPRAAVAVWEEGLRQAPDDPELAAQLAWVLATCREDSIRDGGRALGLARRAVQNDGVETVRAHEALAAALAETGRFEEAADTITRLLSDEAVTLPATVAERLQTQLDTYRSGRPFRE